MTYNDLHVCLAGAHLVDELGVGLENLVNGLAAQSVVGAQVHHDDIGLRGGEPGGEQVLVCVVCSQRSGMAFAIAVEGKSAFRSGAGSDHVNVGEAVVLKLLPEECAPAAL